MVGQIISHYRILEKLGEGGMGVVYKAEDTKLRRTVALKFLPTHAIENRQRFLREAQAAAGLNQPNICTIFEIDEERGFLAMELIDGVSVKEKIAARPLPLEEALDIAMQTCAGLQAAHEKGIVHRDIKSANLMLTAQGQVKIMDFGLAQVGNRTRITKPGSSLGTPAYMSPEQAKGEAVDRRSDIWSFGIVLYEMIAGCLPFRGDTEQAVAYGIVHAEPEPLTAIRTGVPVDLDRVTAKALAKNAANRYQHVEDLLVDLRRVSSRLDSSVGAQEPTAVAPLPGQTGRRRLVLPVAVGALLAVSILVNALLWFRNPASSEKRPVRRFALATKENVVDAVISPDGKRLAFTTGPPKSLWIQDLDRNEPRMIVAEKVDGRVAWSPDGESVAFGTEDALVVKVSADGGLPVTVCRSDTWLTRPSSWSTDGGRILFNPHPSGTVFEVAAKGGEPRQLDLLASGKNTEYLFPRYLPGRPGSRRIVVQENSPSGGARIVAVDLDSRQREVLVEGYRPFYSPAGHVLYLASGSLWALPFSPETLKPTGEPFAVEADATTASVSDDGMLVYVGRGGQLQQLVWRGRDGKEVGDIGQPQATIFGPSLSPDGNRILAVAGEGGGFDVWVHDAAHGLKTRLTFEPGRVDRPVWHSGGNRFSYSSRRAGIYDIYSRRADGSGEAEALVVSPYNEFGSGWSSDGRYLIFTRTAGQRSDIWYLRREVDGTAEETPFVKTEFDEHSPSLSADGRYLAFVTNKSGQFEIYVRTFPAGDREWQVSTKGGSQPRWRKDGKELFYVDPDDTLMAVTVATLPDFSRGVPKRLFQHDGSLRNRGHQYDVTQDGQRFVVVKTIQKASPVIRVVENWFAEIRRRQKP